MQAAAFAFLLVGLRVLILGWRSLSGATVAISLGYLVSGAAAGWLMSRFQGQFLRPHKPPDDR